MRILGVDYGRKKIGLALATSTLAEVYGVVRCETIGGAIEKIKKVARREKIDKLVVGISEGKMAEETKKFAERLGIETGVEVEFQDETLSTKMAKDLSLQAGVKRKRRKMLEDAYTAAIILQDYLDLRGKI